MRPDDPLWVTPFPPSPRVYEYTPPRSRRGARRVRRRHHTDNTNTTTTQRQPRRTALVRAIVIRTIREPHAHVRCLRLDALPAGEPQVFVERHRPAFSSPTVVAEAAHRRASPSSSRTV